MYYIIADENVRESCTWHLGSFYKQNYNFVLKYAIYSNSYIFRSIL